MTDLVDASKALTAAQWAIVWKVHRNTARNWLASLHRRFGDRVVQRYGRQGGYRASKESLKRAGEGGMVTHAQLDEALGRVWGAIESIGGTRTRSQYPKSV